MPNARANVRAETGAPCPQHFEDLRGGAVPARRVTGRTGRFIVSCLTRVLHPRAGAACYARDKEIDVQRNREKGEEHTTHLEHSFPVRSWL